MALQHLRSNTASKRPTPGSMSNGQLAINTNTTSPGVFFKDAGGALIKVGPVHIGTSAPNSSPASGGETGNSIGEQWLDTSGGGYVFKVWDGTAWRSETGQFVDVAGDTMTGNLTISGADLVMSNGEIIAAAGAEATPSITFTGDTNTGIYSPGADQVAIATGGTQRLQIDASGNVGIGTSSPTQLLDLESDSGGRIAFTDTGTRRYSIGNVGTGSSSWSIKDESGSSNRLVIDNSGNVGIGTDSPAVPLEVSGSISSQELYVTGGGDTAGNGISGGFKHGGINSKSLVIEADPNNVGSATAMRFEVDGTERMRIASDGDVGIGTSSPGATLEVSGADQTTSALDTSNLTVSVKSSTLVANSGGSLGFGAATKQWAGIKGLVLNGNDNSIGDLSFSTRRVTTDSTLTEAMRITYNGNVGIGTTSPNNILSIASATPRLEITDTTTSARFLIDAESTVGSVNFRADQDNVVANTTMAFTLDGTEKMRINADGNVGIGTTTPQTSLQVNSVAATGIRSHASTTQTTDTNKAFKVTNGNNTETFNVSYRGAGFFAGNVLFNVDDSSGVDGGTVNAIKVGTDTVVRFSKTGTVSHQFMQFRRNGSSAVIGSIETNGTSTAYNTSSDYRLKENIVPVADGITRLQQLKPSRFNFITDPDATVDGFIAHEVQDVVPEAITGEKDAVDDEGNPEYQGIDQSKLVPLLTAALQEAIGRIETLEAEVAALKAS